MTLLDADTDANPELDCPRLIPAPSPVTMQLYITGAGIEPMRILIVGEKGWRCDDLATSILRRLVDRYGTALTIVHGGYGGVEQSIHRAATSMGLTVEPYEAKSAGMGNRADAIRNASLVMSGAEMCIALHRNLAYSKATKDAARQAIEAGIATYVIDSVEGVPRRLVERDRRLR
jgi:hypothetical protein